MEVPVPLETDGILNIDGFNWSALKLSSRDRQLLTPIDRDAREKAEQDTFALYHQEIRNSIEANRGKVWNTIGDCTIATGFQTIDDAVAAAMTIQRRLSDFNQNGNSLSSSLTVRIGVTRGNLPDLPLPERGELSRPELNESAHLQKHCPPGRIRISRSAYDALRFHRHDFRPSLELNQKSACAGSLVWTQRSLTREDPKHLKKLSQRQRNCYPIISNSLKDFQAQPPSLDFRSISDVLKDCFLIIGETRTKIPEESPISHLASTSDAVGITEVFAALQASPAMLAGIDEWADCEDLATQRNIVIVGSPVVNVYAYAVNTVSPAGFVQEQDGLLRIRVQDSNGTHYFPKVVEHSGFDRHYGLVLLSRNPINPQYNMLWIAGISGMATQAASRFVRDLVLNPIKALESLPTHHEQGLNTAVVSPHWQEGWGAENYQGTWRVTDYCVKWLGSNPYKTTKY